MSREIRNINLDHVLTTAPAPANLPVLESGGSREVATETTLEKPRVSFEVSRLILDEQCARDCQAIYEAGLNDQGGATAQLQQCHPDLAAVFGNQDYIKIIMRDGEGGVGGFALLTDSVEEAATAYANPAMIHRVCREQGVNSFFYCTFVGVAREHMGIASELFLKMTDFIFVQNRAILFYDHSMSKNPNLPKMLDHILKRWGQQTPEHFQIDAQIYRCIVPR